MSTTQECRDAGLFADPRVADVSSIWEFDERVTAPTYGFEDAADYYRQSSAAVYLGKIRVPMLLIQARDDPFIPVRGLRRAFDSGETLHDAAEPRPSRARSVPRSKYRAILGHPASGAILRGVRPV